MKEQNIKAIDDDVYMCENLKYTKCNRAKNKRLNCSRTPIEISLSLFRRSPCARCVNILNSTHYGDVETTSSCKRYLEVTSWILPSFLYFTFEFRFVRLARHLHQQQRRAPAAILLLISSRLAVELAKKMEYCARSL